MNKQMHCETCETKKGGKPPEGVLMSRFVMGKWANPQEAMREM